MGVVIHVAMTTVDYVTTDCKNKKFSGSGVKKQACSPASLQMKKVHQDGHCHHPTDKGPFRL